MPRLYLHQRLSGAHVSDHEGADFPSLEAAREEAVASARELISEASLRGEIDLTARFEIADEAGETLLVVLFSAAVAVKT